LEAAGWRLVRQKGSHVQLRRSGGGSTVTVPHPKSDLPLGTLRSIETQAGMKLGR
jgi:predicted RNA binding protein YcfA (HicA-like mRNA interferase family)